jgi:hypothetical protein
MLFKEIIAVYSENHTKPINTKSSITDCQSRWFIYLPLGLKGCIEAFVLLSTLGRSPLSGTATSQGLYPYRMPQ